jgi:hypothetical protein
VLVLEFSETRIPRGKIGPHLELLRLRDNGRSSQRSGHMSMVNGRCVIVSDKIERVIEESRRPFDEILKVSEMSTRE